MKQIRLFTAIAALGLTACQSDAPKTVSGIITDATMNTVMVTDQDGKSTPFSTIDAQKTVQDGILIGDSVTITYQGIIADGAEIKALTMDVKPAQSPLFGSWVEPIPGIGGEMGIQINRGGGASSINMHTLVFNSWSKDGNTLTLTGQSIGNGQTIDFSDKYNIDRVDADSLILTSEGRTLRYGKLINGASNN